MGQDPQGAFSGEVFTIKNPATTLVTQRESALDRPERETASPNATT